MAVTLRDIAKQLNLSHATVSFVLNDRQDVAIPQTTRQRVIETARDMGYRPNRAARALAKGKTQMIALWIPSTRNPFYASVLFEIQALMRDSDYETIICEAKFGNGDDEVRTKPLEWPVDGILAIDCRYATNGILETMAKDGPPIVSVGVYTLDHGDTVSVDLEWGAREAVRHLIGTGRQRIAFLTVSAKGSQSDPRERAYLEEMKNAGLTPETLVCRGGSRVAIMSVVQDYVKANGFPEALFCYNDHFAVAANKALRESGIRVPEDVAIVGCDGSEETEYVDPPLTTIVQPTAEMCELGWRFLLNRIENPRIERQYAELKPRLAKRQSTAVPKGK